MSKIVITRHPTFIELLRERGIIGEDAEVLAHVANDAQVVGRHVIGVLPLRLAQLCASVTEVPLDLTLEDRAAMQRGDLPLERLREVAGHPVTYRVQRLWSVREAVQDGATAASFNGEEEIVSALTRPYPDGSTELGLLDTTPRTTAEIEEVYLDWSREGSHRGPQDPATRALQWWLGAASSRRGAA